jgi:hypothetical protein
MDLSSIQEKLRRQAQLPVADNLVLPRDWPPAPSVVVSPREQTAPSSPQLVNTVETLRRRSLRSLGDVPISSPPLSPSDNRPANMDPMIWQQELRTMVEKINRLSHEQELTIAALAMTGNRLLNSLTRPDQRSRVPQIDLKHAVTATATLDGHGNVCLTYKPIILEPSDQSAQQLAAQLRRRYGSRKPRATSSASLPPTVLRDLHALLGEPLAWCRYLSKKVLSLLSSQSTRPRTSVAEFKSGLPSLVDTLLWLGSGAIGRLILNLLLSAFPGFWSLAVLGITGILAYALYNATLAARPNFGVTMRLVLLAAGLGLGGYI